MTNRKRFFLNGLLLSAVGIAIRSVSLIFNSYITHSIGAEGIGLFTLIGTVYSFAVTFATSGVSLTTTRLVSSAIGEGKECEVRGMLRSAVKYALAFSAVATLALLLSARYFAIHVLSDKRATVPLSILALSLIPISLSSVFGGYFVGVKRVARNAVVQVAAQAFKIIITVFFMTKFAKYGVGAGICALALSMTLTEICVFLVALVEFLLDKRTHLKKTQAKKSHLKDVAGMALPLAFSAYVRSALLTLEHMLIPKRLLKKGESHSEALTSYGILHGMALPIILYPISPLSSFAGLLVPEFSESVARGEDKRLSRLAKEALDTTLVYAVATMVLLYVFSEEIGYTVYSSYEAGRYISLLAPVLPIMYLDHVTDSMLKGIGEHVYSMWVNITDSLLSIVLVWTLIPSLGIMGYGIVIMVMEGYNFILSYLRLKKRISFRLNFLKSLFIPALSSLVSGLLSRKIFASAGAMTQPVWLFLELIFAACIFIAVNIMLSNVYIKIKNKALE